VKKSRYLVPLISLVATTLLGPTVSYAGAPEIPSSLVVYVGYGDTEGRPPFSGTCADCFPDPWCGSPGIQFIGSSTNYNGNSTDKGNCKEGAWDTAAILVTNTGTASITLTGLTVAIPLPASGDPGSPNCPQPPRPIVFDIWFGQQFFFGDRSQPAYNGGPITVPPGGQAIFAGTSSDGSYTCPTGNYPSSPPKATYDFDTSDANFLTGCTPTTDTVSNPRVTISAAGYSSTTYVDKGHVLDTGGMDPGNCHPTTADPQWAHEWLGWRVIGSACGEYCPHNQLGVAATLTTPAASTTSYVSRTGSTAPGGLDVRTTVAYGIVAAAVAFVVVVSFYASRRRSKLG